MLLHFCEMLLYVGMMPTPCIPMCGWIKSAGTTVIDTIVGAHEPPNAVALISSWYYLVDRGTAVAKVAQT